MNNFENSIIFGNFAKICKNYDCKGIERQIK